MAQPPEVLKAAAEGASTPSTKQRIRIFREMLPSLLGNSELSSEVALLLVDVIFQTLSIYNDRPSRKSVDDLIVTALGEATFMKSFAAAIVQYMGKHLKNHSLIVCYKLIKWSCLLLRWSQFAFVSKGGFLRLATAQAFLCQILMHGSFRTSRACNRMFFHLFSESPDIYKMYIEELKDSRISSRDSAELIRILLSYTNTVSYLFEEYKSIFLDMYVKVVLNAKDKPLRSLGEAFQPIFMHYMEDGEFLDMLKTLSSLSTSPNWSIRHGSLLTLSSIATYNPSMLCQSPLFPSLTDNLRNALKDDKFPIRETATTALGRFLIYQVQNTSNQKISLELLQPLVSALQDESSEVRKRSLSCIKNAAKVNPLAALANLSFLGPAIAECLKDSNTPVRLAAERCALHVFQLTKGADHVQAAQKYITGLDARRLSKLSENSDESDNSEDDTGNA